MIQRVQSIWLFLASLTIFALLVLSVVTKHDHDNAYWILVSGLYQKANGITVKIETFWPLYLLTIAIGAISFFNIFNFKNRILQKRITIINIILTIGLSFWILSEAQKIPGGLNGVSLDPGAFSPLLAILFSALAIRGIRKDEQLIRSADRLR